MYRRLPVIVCTTRLCVLATPPGYSARLDLNGLLIVRDDVPVGYSSAVVLRQNPLPASVRRLSTSESIGAARPRAITRARPEYLGRVPFPNPILLRSGAPFPEKAW